MKKFVTIATVMTILSCHLSFSETPESGLNLSAGADFVSRYVWRGISLSGSEPHIQPWVEAEFGNSGLSLGFWGSYGIGPGSSGTEADIYISYTPVDFLTFTVTDYFFPSDQPFSRDDYFNYTEGETNHTIEAMATFNGTSSFPLWVTFAINIYGNDGIDEDGNNYNASYLEIGYPFTSGKWDIDLFAGMALNSPEIELGAESWYGNSSAGIINAGITLSREVKLSNNITFPVYSSLIFNPEAGNFHIVMGISL